MLQKEVWQHSNARVYTVCSRHCYATLHYTMPIQHGPCIQIGSKHYTAMKTQGLNTQGSFDDFASAPYNIKRSAQGMQAILTSAQF